MMPVPPKPHSESHHRRESKPYYISSPPPLSALSPTSADSLRSRGMEDRKEAEGTASSCCLAGSRLLREDLASPSSSPTKC